MQSTDSHSTRRPSSSLGKTLTPSPLRSLIHTTLFKVITLLSRTYRPRNANPISVDIVSQAWKSTAADDFAKAFSDAQWIISERGRIGWMWPLLEVFGDKTKKSMRVVDGYLDPIMEDAIKKHQQKQQQQIALGEKEGEGEKEVEEDTTLLDNLVKLTNGTIPPPSLTYLSILFY